MLRQENERFKIFFKSLRISQVVFSEIIGKSNANVNAWLNDRTHITGDSQVAILKAYPNLDARWFLFGEGEEMIGTNAVGEPAGNYKQLKPNEMNTLITELIRQLKQKDDQINFLQEQLSGKNK